MAVKPKLDKEAKKALAAERRAASRARRKQIIETVKMVRREDKKLVPIVLGVVLGAIGLAVGLGLLFDILAYTLPIGIAVAVLAALNIFARRAEKSIYAKADGQPGAAGWALGSMRGQWRVSQAVAGTTQLDAVHRVIGRPGVILVAEGAPHRVKPLLAQEKKRVARVVGSTPIYDVIIGNDEKQVPLSKLQRHLRKLPMNINAKQIDVLETRLAALVSRTAALPKGPLPPGAKMRSVQRAARRR